MKKRFVSLCLAGLIMVAPASAVFTDISDSRVSQTAAVLDALGIMQGFAPGKALTRAQFCKLAVTAMGVTDVSPYASYTIFPDVKHSHWAAPYINAAVRHPELKEKSIIRGYADGSFGPNKIVSYGEVCTMLLRMLGYKEEDVGPFWPADYIAQAQAIGLTDGVTIADARAAVKRGDAAVLLLNALNTDKKGEEGSTLLDKVASSTVKDCILLETGKTYSGIAADAALFYEDGVVDAESPRKTAGTLDSSMIGVYGTIVIGKGSSKVAVGVIPNGNKTETYEVVNAEADRIVTTNGTLRPDRKTKLYISRDHVMNEYENAWANLQSGDTLTLYYNEYGVLQLMAVLPKTTAGAAHSFVYGLATSRRIPAEYTIIKNGAKIDASKLKKYDAKNIVVDPVMVATSGAKLISDEAVSTLKEHLFPLATVLTPNIPEAEVLSEMKISNEEEMIKAAEIISEKYGCAVLCKGGHQINDANDLLFKDGTYTWYNGKRINNPNTHGTGCTLSSAIAANLAKGFDLDASVKRAKDYISGALAAMLDLGKGSGPMNHAFDIQSKFTKENSEAEQ